jgi:hypothetical protein
LISFSPDEICKIGFCEALTARRDEPEQMRTLQQLKVKMEVIREAGDMKRITHLLKELAKH